MRKHPCQCGHLGRGGIRPYRRGFPPLLFSAPVFRGVPLPFSARLPVLLALILWRDTVQVRIQQPNRGFGFSPCLLNCKASPANLLGRGIEPGSTPTSQWPIVRFNKGLSVQVRSVFRRSAKLHAGIVHTLQKGGKACEPRACARPPRQPRPSFCCEKRLRVYSIPFLHSATATCGADNH